MMVYYAECSIIVGLGQSIFAAYIFYFFLEFLPKIFLAYDESYQEKCSYELLRILLERLDDLFIVPFKQVYKEKELPSMEKFFSEDFLRDYLFKFDAEHAKSNAAYVGLDGESHPLTFIQYAMQYWCEIKDYVQYLILVPYVRENNELYYQLQFLKMSSFISYYFKLIDMMNGVPLSQVPYITIIGYGKDANNHFCRQQGTVENIVRLHQIAFAIYKQLKGDKRWKDLYAPKFYEE